jgi:hypothetical protein
MNPVDLLARQEFTIFQNYGIDSNFGDPNLLYLDGTSIVDHKGLAIQQNSPGEQAFLN